MYRYMISFSYSVPSGIGFASMEYQFRRPIDSMKDVKDITEIIRKKGYQGVTLLGFSQFATVADKTPSTK